MHEEETTSKNDNCPLATPSWHDAEVAHWYQEGLLERPFAEVYDLLVKTGFVSKAKKTGWWANITRRIWQILLVYEAIDEK